MACILLVDDDPDQLEIRSLILEKAGHQVVSARTAAAALRAFDPAACQIVLMDLRLPACEDGAGLIRELRERHPQVKIFVLSGSPEELGRFPEVTLVDEFLRKPVRSAHLLRLIDRVA